MTLLRFHRSVMGSSSYLSTLIFRSRERTEAKADRAASAFLSIIPIFLWRNQTDLLADHHSGTIQARPHSIATLQKPAGRVAIATRETVPPLWGHTKPPTATAPMATPLSTNRTGSGWMR